MAGIAGIAQSGKQELVEQMLEKIEHRGGAGQGIISNRYATMGMVWTGPQAHIGDGIKKEQAVRDEAKSGHLALARVKDNDLILTRDQIGVAPLYRGVTTEGAVSFASEVKALLDISTDIQEVPPGSKYADDRVEQYFELKKQRPLDEPPEIIAEELRNRLEGSVEKRIDMGGVVGSWLSGGLDSSTMAALARPHVHKFSTFVAGVEGAPDLEFARHVANFIDSDHHEVVVTLEDMLASLQEVIYHLESFDALLVRSSITNFLVAKRAAEYVDAAFSGEGGDELFAGYEYLKSIETQSLTDELIDITGRLHNTALQRVDRSASAHGTVALVGFLDPDVVDYALRIPVEFKLRNGVEKWILREAMDGILPESVVERKKAKFWEGAGVAELLAEHANENISDADFLREQVLPNAMTLHSKEELLYYRIFREHFGELEDLSWMGRTRHTPDRS